MKFSYNLLQSYFEEKLVRPDKLAMFLTMHLFEAKGMKKIKNDWQLDIDVLPNRADCLSHLGIAREIKTITNLKFKTQNSKLTKNKDLKINKELKIKDFITVEIKDKFICPRYTARVITNVKISSSPQWLKERLEVCGLNSINNIVDIVNYVMLEIGQPLHVFDYDKIKGKKIIVRRAKKGEEIITLEGEKYELDKDILVIADREGILALAGLKGGKKAEIDKNTKNIILESANFNRLNIRKASQKLNIKTESSLRFEHGLDPNLTEIAINRAVDLIKTIGGGEVIEGMVDIYPIKILPQKIKLDLDYLETLLGLKIEEEKIKNILERLNLKIRKQKKKILEIEIPSYRRDLLLSEDLIEEVGRIYSYEKIKPQFPVIPLVFPKENYELSKEKKIKEMLRNFGFTEVYNYSFISEDDYRIFSNYSLTKRNNSQFGNKTDLFEIDSKDIIEIENPTSSNTKYLRPILLLNLFKVIKNNQKNFPYLKIFEIGKIYQKENNKLIEKKNLSVLIACKKDKFFELKGILETFFEELHLKNVSYRAPEREFFFFKRKKIAEIRIDERKIGYLGEISPEFFELYSLDFPVFAFEINLEMIFPLIKEEYLYKESFLSPPIKKDLAIIVPQKVLVGEVIEEIKKTEEKNIQKIELFDIYQGPPLKKDEKNLAFHFIYQNPDKILKPDEVGKIQERIIQTFKKKGWKVREF